MPGAPDIQPAAGRNASLIRENWATVRLSALSSDDLFAWTGLNSAQLRARVDRLWVVRPDSRRGRPWALDFADRVLLIVMAYRANLTDRRFSAVFGGAKSTADRVVHDFARTWPASSTAHPPTGELWLVDGTLVPVHHHTRMERSKNYRRSSSV